MRALVLTEFGRMRVVDVQAPEPAADEAVLTVVATGICGSDLHGFTGENGRRVPGQIMGHESVGVITTLGSAARDADFRIGQPVTFNPVVVPPEDRLRYAGREQHCPDRYVIGVRPDVVAAFAERIAVPIRNLVPFASTAPIRNGALAEPLAVGVHAVRRVGVTADQGVVVIGGGPIGQSVVVALKMAGLTKIIVSEVNAERRRLVRQLGAQAVDPRSGRLREAVIRGIGAPANAAIDAVGTSATLADALSSTAAGGVVGLVGMQERRLDVDAFAVSTEERSILGCFTYGAGDFADAAAWIAGQPEIANHLISDEVSLDEAPAAFSRLAGGEIPAGKVLVRLGNGGPDDLGGDDGERIPS